MESSFISKLKTLKKSFYNFKDIHRIDDYSLNTTKSLQPNQDPDHILQSFHKNITTYLIIKRHLNSHRNLASLLRKYKEKKGLSIENMKPTGGVLIFDEQGFKEIADQNSRNFLNIEYKIDDGNAIGPKITQSIQVSKLESKFLKKYEVFLNEEKYASEALINNLYENFKHLINRIRNEPFVLKLPKRMKAVLQNYNDFYIECNEKEDETPINSEIIDPIPSEKKIENEEKKIETEIDIEELLIDQIMINEPKTPVEQDNNDSKSNSSNHSESEKKGPNSKKMLKKFQKYLNHHPKEHPPPSPPTKLIQREQNKPPIQEILNSNSQSEFSQLPINISPQKIITNITNIEPEIKKQQEKVSNMDLIDRLLQSNDLFNEDLSEYKGRIEYPKIPEDLKFSDEMDREIFEKIYKWLFEVELQIEKDKIAIDKYEKEYQKKLGDFDVETKNSKDDIQEESSQENSQEESDNKSEEEENY